MRRGMCLIGLLATACAGCKSDIVTTAHLKQMEEKCVYIAPLQSEDPQVGEVIRGVLEKEFLRKRIALCDPNSATVVLSGATFMTVRSKRSGPSGSVQACESVSVTAKDRDGNILLSASYDNSKRETVSEFAKEFGAALAVKFR